LREGGGCGGGGGGVKGGGFVCAKVRFKYETPKSTTRPPRPPTPNTHSRTKSPLIRSYVYRFLRSCDCACAVMHTLMRLCGMSLCVSCLSLLHILCVMSLFTTHTLLHILIVWHVSLCVMSLKGQSYPIKKKMSLLLCVCLHVSLCALSRTLPRYVCGMLLLLLLLLLLL